MEKFHLRKDIKVFYVSATTFPKGISEAHQKLHRLLPHTEGRQFYGISHGNTEGGIDYKAAVAESFNGEGKSYNCETFVIQKGTYIRETLIDWRKDEEIVAKTFQMLLTDPRLDPNSYCLEVYLGENDMRCMVKLKDEDSKKMSSRMKKTSNMDTYIADFPEEIQKMLEQVRATIKEVAPNAEETIKYGMPTFMLNGSNLVFFAAFKNHIGFYATPTGHQAFKSALSPYKQGKGSVQFPLDKPMPLDLITQIVKFRVNENLKRLK